MRSTITVTVGFLVSSLCACQAYDPERVEQNFGHSVRQMISEQTYTTEGVVTPAEAGPDRMDGATAVRTIEQYQEAARKDRQGVTSAGFGAQ